ncbi:MAG: efflux RND transporter periplasmic adaptor subunit [Burkholderiaceae bacterium]|nr:efflux RND transporter periplasmic adaptor subunit [Rhodoferax sp.]MCP5260885.1 efflux RND transporter periplasmic adaptor subunit [Rhodoferax sp.]MCW5629126.1 efflux RND transporter periplasmic adaptor subunit [Rhodoferax sp.]MCW5643968.1 efflux RND transporter periplasmic adaptor subunit [Rhodoferax sp.]
MSLQPITSAALVVLACLVTAGPARAVDGEYQCLIEPYRRIEIRSAVEALIDKVHVQRGSVVRKGQRLVELQSDVERAALDSAKFRAVMEGSMRSAEARVDYARDKLRRREELSRQNFVSSQERDDAAAEMRVAQAELLEARDNRQLAVLESKRLEELLRQRTLISPFDGVVTEVEQHPGELAQTGEGARPILTMAQIHPLRVEVVLPVALYNQIKAGAAAEIEAEAPTKGRFKATVQIVDKVVDSASGTFGVRLELPNPAGNMPAGVKCKVRFR